MYKSGRLSVVSLVFTELQILQTTTSGPDESYASLKRISQAQLSRFNGLDPYVAIQYCHAVLDLLCNANLDSIQGIGYFLMLPDLQMPHYLSARPLVLSINPFSTSLLPLCSGRET